MKAQIARIQPWIRSEILRRQPANNPGANTLLFEGYPQRWSMNAWCAGIDFSSACIGAGTWRRGGVLIGKRHAMFTHHYPVSPGLELRWMNRSNTTLVRTVTAVESHPWAAIKFGFADVQVATLSSGIDDIVPAPILHPYTITDSKTTRLFRGAGPAAKWENRMLLDWPIIVIDSELKALVWEIMQVNRWDYNDGTQWHVAMAGIPRDCALRDCHEKIVIGDSGGPWFMITPSLSGRLTAAVIGLTSAQGQATWVPEIVPWLRTVVPDLRVTDPYMQPPVSREFEREQGAPNAKT